MQKYFLTFILLVASLCCYSQHEQTQASDTRLLENAAPAPSVVVSEKKVKEKSESKSAIGWQGQFVLSTNGSNLFLTLGGPSIRAELSRSFAISYCLMPSVRYNMEEEDKNRMVQTILGTGLTFQYKKFLVALPVYFLPAPKNYWSMAFGIGYKL